MPDAVVSPSELDRRTIRRSEFVSCNQAFIDCRTPGSDRKENYAMIGSGCRRRPASSSICAFRTVTISVPRPCPTASPTTCTCTTRPRCSSAPRASTCCAGAPTAPRASCRCAPVTSSPSRPGSSAGSPTPGRTTDGCSPCSAWTTPAASSGARPYCGRPRGHGLYLTADNQLVDTVAGDEIREGVEPRAADGAGAHRPAAPLQPRGDEAPDRRDGRTRVVREPVPRQLAARCGRTPELCHRVRHDRGPAPGAAHLQPARPQASPGCGPNRARASPRTASTRRRRSS